MKKVSIFLFLVSLFLFGCTSENEEFTPYPTNKSNTFTVSEQDAIGQVLAFVNQVYGTTRSNENLKVASVKPWLSKTLWKTTSTRGGLLLPDTALYIVNMSNDDGFALVSADSRVSGVMAFVEKGSLSPDSEVDNPGFKVFLNGLQGYFEKKLSITRSITRSNLPVSEYEVHAEPMLTTNWGQGAPYNMYCFTETNEQAVAGCIAIATAQICAYHQWPEEFNGHVYDWEAILASDKVSVNNTIAANSVGHLVRDIGGLVGMNYGVNGSSASSSNVGNCFDTFNYFYQWNTAPTFGAVDSTLIGGMPVYFRGQSSSEGHAWVIDGSAVRSAYVQELGPGGYTGGSLLVAYDPLVHCNWGWNGNMNGFFLYGAFESRYDETDESLVNDGFPYDVNNKCYLGVEVDWLSYYLGLNSREKRVKQKRDLK